MLTSIHDVRNVEHFLNSRMDNSTLLDYRITLRLNLDIDISVLSKKSNNRIFLSELNNKGNTQKLHVEVVTLSDFQQDDFYEYLFSKHKNPNSINLVNIAFPDWVQYKNSKKPSRFPKP